LTIRDETTRVKEKANKNYEEPRKTVKIQKEPRMS